LLALQTSHWLELHPDRAQFARQYAGLPDDFVNFQHDPLASAVAAGWDGVEITTMPLVVEQHNDLVIERVDPAGMLFQVMTSVQGERFNTFWLDCITK
jgi:hypothetical protein